jgi:hypothetical protein
MNFELLAFPNGSRGTRKTYKASAQVDFGKLVYLVSSTVQETSAATDIAIGTALNDDVYESENEDTYYASGNPVTVALRGAGEVINLTNTGGVTEGETVTAAADGAVATQGSVGTNDYQIIGIALETKTAGNRGEVLVL